MINFKIFVGKKNYADVRDLIHRSLVGNPGYVNSSITITDEYANAGIISFSIDGGEGNRLGVTADVQLTGASFFKIPEPIIVFNRKDLEEAEKSHYGFSGETEKEDPMEEPDESSHFVPVLTPEELDKNT